MIFKIPYTSFLMAALLTLWAGSFFFFYSLVEAQWIYNVLIIPAVQRSDSAIQVHGSILLKILFPHRLSQNTG